MRDLRIQTYRKINKLPLKYIDGHAHGDMISRIVNDVDQVSDGLLQGLTQLFTGVVTIVGTLIFMLTISPVITVVVVLVTPLSLFVAGFIARLTHRQFREQQATQGELSGYVEELISGQKVVKTFHYEKRAEGEFREINSRLYKCGVKAQFYSAISNPATRFVNGIVYTSVAVIGSICAITGRPGPLTIGQISSFLTYANQYTKPFNEVTSVITQIQTAFASAQRLFDLLDEPEELPDAPDAVVLHSSEGNIAVEHLDFSYNPKVKLIRNMNITAHKGDRIAIVAVSYTHLDVYKRQAALLSEIPYDWAFTGMPFQWEEQNVIFTLFLGLCAVWALQAWQERYPIFAFSAIAACVVAAELIHCDYGGTGVLFVVVFYCCRTLKSRGTVAFGLINIGDSLLYQDRIQPFAIFAVAPVILYNGRRGKYRLRSFFYLFYPLHLLLLRIIYEVAF